VGHLWRNPTAAICFRYNPERLSRDGFAISYTLPPASDDFTPEDGIAHRFFANLLLEGGVREQIVRDLKISNTDFNLLRAIGRECAGALSILPIEQQPSPHYYYHPINENWPI